MAARERAWGCYKSHLNLIEQCVNEDVASILIFEDDAEFVDQFAEKVNQFIKHLPEGWQQNSMVYFGGQHLHTKLNPPRKINDFVYQPYNVNRTHAFALCGQMIKTVYHHLIQTQSWWRGHHIDHHLGRFHQKRIHPVYVPHQWLVLQSADSSDISGKVFKQSRLWTGAAQLATNG